MSSMLLGPVDEDDAALGGHEPEERIELQRLLGDYGHLLDVRPELEEAEDVQRALVVDHEHGR